MIETLGNASGFRLNYRKREAFWIGSVAYRKVAPSPEKKFKWPEQKLKALGAWFSNDPQTSLSLNLLERLETVKKCLSSWNLRSLSLIGKIVVLKSLVTSQLVYVLTSLQSKESISKEIIAFSMTFCETEKAIK